MRNVLEIEKDQKEYAKKIIDKEVYDERVNKPNVKRIKPTINCTLNKSDLDFLKDLTLFYSYKKRKVFSLSKTLRIILKYSKDFESELKDYI